MASPKPLFNRPYLRVCDQRQRQIRHTLYTRQFYCMQPLLTYTEEEPLKVIHTTAAVAKTKDDTKDNEVFGDEESKPR